MAVDLLPDEDQIALLATVGAILDDHPYGTDPWSALVDIGLFGLAVPEEQGGVGLGLAELSLVFRAFGRHLTRGPLLGGVVAATLAARAGDSPLLATLLAGEHKVAIAEPTGAEHAILRAVDADAADYLLVLTPERAALVDAATATVTALTPLDPTAPPARVEPGTAEPILVEAGGEAFTTASLLVAAHLGGVAEGALADSVRYVKTREQFGVAIGSFQAVKHRCATQAVYTESAVSLAGLATLAHVAGQAEAPTLLMAARVYCAEAARSNAADNIQNHGGMGFTMEASPHRFARRAATYANVVGTLRGYQDALARS